MQLTRRQTLFSLSTALALLPWNKAKAAPTTTDTVLYTNSYRKKNATTTYWLRHLQQSPYDLFVVEVQKPNGTRKPLLQLSPTFNNVCGVGGQPVSRLGRGLTAFFVDALPTLTSKTNENSLAFFRTQIIYSQWIDWSKTTSGIPDWDNIHLRA